MSTTLTFQTELVTIMDVLTKAAVTEISKLLEDGYAELRLAISQCHRENEELKRQLAIQMGANRRTPESSASCDVITGGCVVHIHRDKRRNSVAEGVRSELIADQCGDIESSTLDSRWIFNKKCVHKGEERGESQCIKVERLEDDLKSFGPPQGHSIGEKRALDSEGAVRASVEDLQTEQAVGTEFCEHHSSRHDDWEDGRLGSVLKAEPAHENGGILDTRSELTAGRLNCQGHEYNFYEGPSEVNTVLTERTIETETEDPIHCYLRDPNSDSYLAQSERRLIPATAKDSGKNVLSMGSLCRTDSALFEMGADVCFIWNKEMPSGPRSSVCSELTSSGTPSGRNSSTLPSLCAKQLSFALWSDGESMSVNEDHSVRGEESAGMEEGSGSLHVKEETPEDLQSENSQRGPIISDGKLVESSGGESTPSVEVQSEPVVDTEEPPERRSTRHSVWEDGKLDTIMNAEPDTEPVKLQASAERLYRLGNESVLYERPALTLRVCHITHSYNLDKPQQKMLCHP
ncbi:hypothetical protein GJAV_G00095230 [Gymnothorax javanicus]|nr:hypothetical protein GJAV_G00095230 [Gymnothorax javanicus]